MNMAQKPTQSNSSEAYASELLENLEEMDTWTVMISAELNLQSPAFVLSAA